MKKKLIIISTLLAIIGAFIIYSCSEEGSNMVKPPDKTQRLTGMTSLTIPDDCKEDLGYNGPVYSNIVTEVINYGGTDFTVQYEVEWSSNTKIIYIAVTTTWANTIGLHADDIKENDNGEMAESIDENNSPPEPGDGFWAHLKYWLVGETICGPCIDGTKICTWSHPFLSRDPWEHPC